MPVKSDSSGNLNEMDEVPVGSNENYSHDKRKKPGHGVINNKASSSTSTVMGSSNITATPTTNTSLSLFYYIAGHNGASLVEAAMQARAWKRCTDKNSVQIRLIWTELLSQVNYSAFREGEQLVNHIPNCGLITNKLGLLLSLRDYEKTLFRTSGVAGSDSTNSVTVRPSMNEFVPETYIVDDLKEREAFYASFKDGDVWIYKPTGANQGKGISLVRDLQDFKQMMLERDEESKKSLRGLKARILQRYIPRPLLIQNRKFDIRCYMLIASTTPFLVLFHPGYLRLSIHPYSLDGTDLTIHLTNQFIQKKDPSYQDVKDDTVWSMDKFTDYINDNYRESKGLPLDWVRTVLDKQMQKYMLHVFLSVKSKLSARLGFFELYGFDFMIDESMKVWLIEVNVNPAMHTNCDELKRILPPLIAESIDIALECFEKSRRDKPLLPLQSIKRYTIIYQPPNSTRQNGARNSPKNGIGYWVAPRYRPHCLSPQRTNDHHQASSPVTGQMSISTAQDPSQQQSNAVTSIHLLPLQAGTSLTANRNFENSLRRYERKTSWNYSQVAVSTVPSGALGLPSVLPSDNSPSTGSPGVTIPRSTLHRSTTMAQSNVSQNVSPYRLKPSATASSSTFTPTYSNGSPVRETVRLSTVQVVTGGDPLLKQRSPYLLSESAGDKNVKRSGGGRRFIDFSA